VRRASSEVKSSQVKSRAAHELLDVDLVVVPSDLLEGVARGVLDVRVPHLAVVGQLLDHIQILLLGEGGVVGAVVREEQIERTHL
jgi:hypothetical protein